VQPKLLLMGRLLTWMAAFSFLSQQTTRLEHFWTLSIAKSFEEDSLELAQQSW
jgi:hypothetical protein